MKIKNPILNLRSVAAVTWIRKFQIPDYPTSEPRRHKDFKQHEGLGAPYFLHALVDYLAKHHSLGISAIENDMTSALARSAHQFGNANLRQEQLAGEWRDIPKDWIQTSKA